MKSWYYFNRLTNSSGFRGAKVISPDLVLVYTTPPTVRMKKPTQVGATILEWSKYFMMEKWHKFIIPNFQSVSLSMSDTGECEKLNISFFFVQFTNSSLIFSTDSFLFSTKLEDGKSIEDKLLQHADHFDFSNISPSSKLYSMEHKNELNRQVKYDLKNQRQIILIS